MDPLNKSIEEEINCASYLHYAQENNCKHSYLKFKEIFDVLSDERKYNVINYYLAWSKDNIDKGRKRYAKR